jgi:hypothetical protein
MVRRMASAVVFFSFFPPGGQDLRHQSDRPADPI